MASSLLAPVVILFFLSLSAKICVHATEYTVGDGDGWDTGTNYLLWSQNHNFTVGDVLVFNYVRVLHNVYQVTEETFRSCNWSSGVLNMYNNGSDRVTLAEPTSFWFICAVEGHCQGGMRMGVRVAASSGGAAAPAPEEPSHDAGNGVGRAVVRWWWVVSWSTLLMVWGLQAM
ncbi:mavicyanin-like [Curcuma longa]|uniref:mavicyanin-like n=1 Tax=Curcuma longa TaxID=136217 RepID=UPI003D9DC30F